MARPTEPRIVLRSPLPYLVPPHVPRRFTTLAACGAEKARLRQQLAVASPGGMRHRHLQTQLDVLDDLIVRHQEAERDRAILLAQRTDLQRAMVAAVAADGVVQNISRLRAQAEADVVKLDQRARHPGLPPGVAGNVAGQLATARHHCVATAARWEEAFAKLASAIAEEAQVRRDIAVDVFLTGVAVHTVYASTHRGLAADVQSALLAPNVASVHVADSRRCLCAPQSDAGGPAVFSPLAALSRLAGFLVKPQLQVLEIDARTLPDRVQSTTTHAEA